MVFRGRTSRSRLTVCHVLCGGVVGAPKVFRSCRSTTACWSCPLLGMMGDGCARSEARAGQGLPHGTAGRI